MRRVSTRRGGFAVRAEAPIAATVDPKLRLRIAVSMALMLAAGEAVSTVAVAAQATEPAAPRAAEPATAAAEPATPAAEPASAPSNSAATRTPEAGSMEEVKVTTSRSKERDAINPVSMSSMGFAKEIGRASCRERV